jgi:hypothetical protein
MDAALATSVTLGNFPPPQPITTPNVVEAEEHDEQIDHPTRGPLMSLCVQCAQPTLGSSEFCAHHITGHTDDWATGNRLMCDFLHRGIVPATPHGIADPFTEPLDDTLEVALTA